METEIKNEDLENFISSLERSFYAINSDLYFKSFQRRVRNNEVFEDGKDELLCILDDYILDDKSIKLIPSDTILYRARIINLNERKKEWGLGVSEDNKLIGFNEAGSREAPLGKSTEGRNNISGVSYLYLSNNAETACSEVKPTITQLISVAEFLVKEPIRVIDFTENKLLECFIKEKSIDLGALFARIMERYFLPVIDPFEYKATQIITEHIRKTGVDGVSYRSFFDAKGTNYTIFNSDRRRFEFLGSRIVSLQNEKRVFWDYNNNRSIEAQTMGPKEYDQKTADKMVKIIGNELQNSAINE